jgi:hypothetical protein
MCSESIVNQMTRQFHTFPGQRSRNAGEYFSTSLDEAPTTIDARVG